MRVQKRTLDSGVINVVHCVIVALSHGAGGLAPTCVVCLWYGIGTVRRAVVLSVSYVQLIIRFLGTRSNFVSPCLVFTLPASSGCDTS